MKYVKNNFQNASGNNCCASFDMLHSTEKNDDSPG